MKFAEMSRDCVCVEGECRGLGIGWRMSNACKTADGTTRDEPIDNCRGANLGKSCNGTRCEMAPPSPRRLGSFHPRALDSVIPLSQAPSSSYAPRRFVVLLLVVALLVAAPIVLALTVTSAASTAASLPPALSIGSSLAACGLWAWQPVRSAHFGQVVCVCLACACFSSCWLLMLIARDPVTRCAAFKLALAGWVASFLWCWPLGLDWLLLMTGARRGSGNTRRALSYACHLTWVAAAALALPLVRANALPANATATAGFAIDDAIAAAAAALPSCTLSELAPSWWPWVLAGAWAATYIFNVVVYLACGSRHAESTPRVVSERHRRRARCFALAFCTLQPPTALNFWYVVAGGCGGDASSGGISAPPLLALWAAFLGVTWQGAFTALTHAWHEPLILAAVSGAACRDCAGRDGGGAPLAHADSRFVHFEESFLSNARDHEGSAEATEVVRRVLEAERQAVEADVPFRLALCLLPAGLVAAGLVFVLVRHV